MMIMSVMVMGYRYGVMVRLMKECGSIIRQTVRENLYMRTAKCMKVVGKMIKCRAGEDFSSWMEQHMLENGSRINSMGVVLNAGQMAPTTKENINVDTRKVKGSYTGQTVVTI